MSNEYVIVNSKTNSDTIWSTIASTYTPSKGEVCIIVPTAGNFIAKEDLTNDDGSYKIKQIGIKIGDGKNVFRDLPTLTDVSGIRPDWEETDTNSPNYIWHKPIINTDMIEVGEIKNLKITNRELNDAKEKETRRFPDTVGEEYYPIANLSNIENFTNPLNLLILEDGTWGYYDYTIRRANSDKKEKEIRYFYKKNISEKSQYSSVDMSYGQYYGVVYSVIENIIKSEVFENNAWYLSLFRHDKKPVKFGDNVDEDGNLELIEWNFTLNDTPISFMLDEIEYENSNPALFYYNLEKETLKYIDKDNKLSLYSLDIKSENISENFKDAYLFFQEYYQKNLSAFLDVLTQELIEHKGIVELSVIYGSLYSLINGILSVEVNKDEELTTQDYALMREISNIIQEHFLDWETLAILQDSTTDIYQHYYEINDEVIIDPDTTILYVKKSKIDNLFKENNTTESIEIKVEASVEKPINQITIPADYPLNSYYVKGENGISSGQLDFEGDNIYLQTTDSNFEFQDNTLIKYTQSNIKDGKMILDDSSVSLNNKGYYNYEDVSDKQLIFKSEDGKRFSKKVDIYIEYESPQDITLKNENENRIELNTVKGLLVKDFKKIHWKNSIIELTNSKGLVTILEYGVNYFIHENTAFVENVDDLTFDIVFIGTTQPNNYKTVVLKSKLEKVLLNKDEDYQIEQDLTKIKILNEGLIGDNFKLSYNIDTQNYIAYRIKVNSENIINIDFSSYPEDYETETIIASYFSENKIPAVFGVYYKIVDISSNQIYYYQYSINKGWIRYDNNGNYYYEVLSERQQENDIFYYYIRFNFDIQSGSIVSIINSSSDKYNNLKLTSLEVNENKKEQTVKIEPSITENVIFIFSKPQSMIDAVEMNFYYRKQQLRQDLLSGLAPDWETNSDKEVSYIANRPMYLVDGKVHIVDKYKKAIENIALNIHNTQQSKSTLLEAQVQNLVEQNKVFATFLNQMQTFQKKAGEDYKDGIEETGPEATVLVNNTVTNLVGILPVLQQVINEIKYLYDLINSKTEVIISSDKPDSNALGKLWINNSDNAGNGLLYYREGLNSDWIPLSALWTDSSIRTNINTVSEE